VTKLTDETLVAYVDGTLEPSERQQVETLLESDPEARDRLEGFRITGRLLAELMQRHVPSPSPKRLLDGVLPEETKPGPAVYEHFKQQSAGFPERIGAQPFLIPVFAMVLIAGIGVGWFLSGNASKAGAEGNNLALFENDHMHPPTMLLDALEKIPSNVETTGAILSKNNAKRIKIRQTFRNNKSQYCREYETGDPVSIRKSGIACRQDDGQWLIHIQAFIAPINPVQTYIPAGGTRNTMDFMAKALMDGPPLAKNEEASAIANGWKR
jgi:hypothetical protein